VKGRDGAALQGGAVGATWIRAALVAIVLSLVIGWVVVYLPPGVGLALAAGGFAATLWLQAPVLALYGLAAICPFDLAYEVAGLSDVRLQDILLLAMAVPAVTAIFSRSPRRLRLKTPMAAALLGLWTFLLVWGSITFLLGPVNQWLLKDAFHNSWYVYRDIGRSLLIFPLVIVCYDNRRSIERVIDILVAVGAGVALNAIWLARGSEDNATGNFGTTNALAGFLILIIPFAAARLFMNERWAVRVPHAAALLVMLRALWLAGSRGGLVAFLASMGVLALLVPRRRAVAAGAVALVVLSFAIGMRGGLLELPMMQRFIVLTDVKDVETFQWRQEQWGLFIQRIRERPWLGTGSDVDESLREMDRARTAHNAFLALSMKSGIPTAVAWGLVLLLALALFVRGVMVRAGPGDRAFWIGGLGFLVALIVHNMVESTLLGVVTQHIFWLVTAAALVLVSPGATDHGRPAASHEALRPVRP
jgi:O-antigen ligase